MSDGDHAAFGREVRQLRTQVLVSHAEARLEADRAAALVIENGRLADWATQEANGHREAIIAMNTATASAQAAQAALAAMQASTLWRATGPARAIGRRFPRATRLAGRGVKLAWWIATLQVARRYRLRQEYRLAMAQATTAMRELPTPDPEGASQLPSVEAQLALNLSTTPRVSVIISTFGQPLMTLGCLRALADTPPDVATEIILVDDAAPDEPTLNALHKAAAASGIRIIRNENNLGFLRSCNKAARLARGEFLLFLNNDTVPWPGAVDALVDVLDQRPEAAMAGSKLIYPDGRLQEAGGILWDDGSAWNYGRGQDRSRPEFNYVREADYCSGASILVRRVAFERMGGFDEAFLPAYCEDTDLAFRLRAAGETVLYAPRSVVVHHEGASHGTDLRQGIKAHQTTNMARMEQRWRAVLRHEHFPHGTNLLRARDRAKARIVALVVDHYPLRPDRDAGSRALMALMQALLDSGWVVKYWPENQAYDAVYTPKMEALGIEVIDQRGAEPFERWLERDGKALDHVVVARPETAAASIGPLLRNTDAALSYFGHDLHFRRLRTEAETTGDASLAAESMRLERLERRIWRLFDRVIYLSKAEAETVRELEPGVDARSIVPFTFPIESEREAAPIGREILFVAGFAHSPNVDAATLLVREVLPSVEAAVGPVTLVLAGSDPTDRVRALARPGIEVTGFVTDAELKALYRRARAAIVPLRFGAGVKGKVVEALCHGLPLVTTPVGAQGLEGLAAVIPVHEEHASMAASLIRLLTDDQAWLAQSQAELEYAAGNFSRASLKRSVLNALT